MEKEEKNKTLYFDYAATSPVHQQVLESMLPYFSIHYGNPSSVTHPIGLRAKAAVQNSKRLIANFLAVDESEITFTSGATEANNAVIKGIFERYSSVGNHIISSKTEHKSVVETINYLEEYRGASVTWLSTNRDGEIDLQELQNSLQKETILISLMTVNNETGTVLDAEAVYHVIKDHHCIFVSDASQAMGKVNMKELTKYTGALTFSAHKINGPKGIGAVYLSRRNPRVSIIPLIHGGEQENNLRAGTLNTPAVVGFAKAVEIHAQNQKERMDLHWKFHLKLKSFFSELGGELNGGANRIPQIMNVKFTGKKADKLLKKNPNLFFSLGSACNEALENKSHVLSAMGLNKEEVAASIRISFGLETTIEDIDHLIQTFNC